MKNEICLRTGSNVAGYLANGDPLDEALLAHIKGCSACAVTLQRAHALGALLEEPATALSDGGVNAKLSSVVTSEVVAAVKRRRIVRVALGTAIILFGSFLWISIGRVPEMRSPAAVWVVAMTLFTLPLLAAVAFAGVDVGPARIYKRMRGRQLSGVCQGLSEAFSIPVWLLRMAFVALVFLKGTGIIAYLVCDAFMQIHPEDRPDLLRFRVARWWKRRFAAA